MVGGLVETTSAIALNSLRSARAELFGCGLIDSKSLRIDHHAVFLRRGLHADIALTHVLLHILGRTFEGRAVAATAAGADAERIARLELRYQHLGVREIRLPLVADPERHLVA